MVSVEHLGQYVYEITQAKVKAMKEGEKRLMSPEEAKVYHGEMDEEDDGGNAEIEDHEEDEQ